MDYDKEEWKNQRLREEIIELSNMWNGKESKKYGTTLKIMLDKLEIKYLPKAWCDDFTKFLEIQECLDCGLKMMHCECVTQMNTRIGKMNCKKCHHEIDDINCNEQGCKCVCWE